MSVVRIYPKLCLFLSHVREVVPNELEKWSESER